MPPLPGFSYDSFRGTLFREKAPGSPKFSFNDEGHSRCIRTYYTPWQGSTDGDTTALWLAAQNFLGWSRVNPGHAANPVLGITYQPPYIERQIPHTHPNFPGFFFADSIADMEGTVIVGQDQNQVGKYTEAMFSVNYSAPLYQVMDDVDLMNKLDPDGSLGINFPDEASLLRYVTVDYQSAGKYQTLPSFTALKWVPEVVAQGQVQGGAMTNTAAVLLAEGDLTIEWHKVPIAAFPRDVVLRTVGCTNNKPFGHPDSVCGTLPAGSMVCHFPKIKLIRLINGVYAYHVTYRFKVYPYGANRFYRFDRKIQVAPNVFVSVPGFQEATRDGISGQGQLFPPANYDLLFRPPAPAG